ncbi:MAG: hypothetical protein AABY15_06805 [Nanoarchaeota archaeon]
MKKCVIIISTTDGKIVSPVANFSKENCVNALAKAIKVDADKVEQLSASMSYGIYAMKEYFKSAEQLATNPISDSSYFANFHVEYGYMAD